MADLLRIRRDTSANWASTNPVLSLGEPGYTTDTKILKIGDGSTAWNSLPAFGPTPTGIGALEFDDLSAAPSPPAAGLMQLWAQPFAGRQMPRFQGQHGFSTTVGPFQATNKIGTWSPPGNATTVPAVDAYTALTAVGTATARNVATTNMFTRARRLGYVSAATAGALASLRLAVAQITTGTGTLGGFMKVIRFGISDAAAVAAARMFVGMGSNTGAPTNVEPSTLTNVLGVGHGAADTTMKIFYGGSAAQTPIDLGADFPANTRNTDLYELALFCPTASANVNYQVTRLNTGHVASGVLASSGGVATPAATTLLTPTWMFRTNNTTALAVGLDIVSDYFETDV